MLFTLGDVNQNDNIMEKYKLIKKYPNSPKLGTIIDRESEEFNHVMNYDVEMDDVRKYPEYWQKVVEKDYEIYSYRGLYTQSIYRLHTSGMYVNENGVSMDFKQKNWKQAYSIHSLKRLSDGEVFTVGDNILHKNPVSNRKGQIKYFEIVSDKIFVHTNSFNTPLVYIELDNKHLFTTDDGVDIYVGDVYFELALTFTPKFRFAIYYEIGRSNIRYNYNTFHGKKKLNELGRYYFRSKSLAEEFAILRNPCLSINDCIDFKGSKDRAFLKSYLIDKVKSKLNE